MQATLFSSFSLSGIGIHSGTSSRVTVLPAAINAGIRFVADGREFPAHWSKVIRAVRCTTLGESDIEVSMVEHLLSALAGCGITNARVEVEGCELPILDGSALPWVEAIRSVGVNVQATEIPLYHLTQPLVMEYGTSHYMAVPSNGRSLTTVTSWDHPMLGTQIVWHDGSANGYCSEIAPARTFGFEEEVAELRASGFALGGALDNALVVGEDGFSSPLRMPNECHCHKMLDLIGDLSLMRHPICAEITVIRPGHAGNVKFAELLETTVS